MIALTKIKKVIMSDGVVGFLKKCLNRFKKIIFNFINSIFINFFRLLPLKQNYIILESEGDYTDNVLTIYNYLVNNEYTKKYKLIWFVHNPAIYPKAKNVLFISRFYSYFNIKADYYIGVSKFFVFSHPYWLKNWRKKQIVINTSHSVSQLKKGSIVQKNKIFDYVLCCSDYCSSIKQEIFAVSSNQVLTIGMPRIDLLYTHKRCIEKLYHDLSKKKIILLMETFKQSNACSDSENINRFAINVVHNISELNILDNFLLQKNCVLIIKIHHLQNLQILNITHLESIKFLSDEDLNKNGLQVNDLLENADVLLTDYSSVFYEYLLLDRPIGFLIGDINEYKRGFLMEKPLGEMPGEKIRSLDELLLFLANSVVGSDVYREAREQVRNKVFKYFDANNCKRLAEWIDQH